MIMAQTLYPFGVGGQTPSGIGLNKGTFAEAYDMARANNYIFPWMLIGEDNNGNPIKKMIWHVGNGEFIDAIGDEIDGQKNGLTIKVNEDCDMLLGSTTYPLTAGVNFFPFGGADGIDWDGTSVITTFSIRESGTTTEHSSYVEEIDFGGLKLQLSSYSLSQWSNLTRIERLDASMQASASNVLWKNYKLKEIQMTGTGVPVHFIHLLHDCQALKKADLRGFQVTFDGVTGMANCFKNCYELEYADIRDIDTLNCTTFQRLFESCRALKTLVVGNFTNASITDKSYAFSEVTDCVLICTTSEPPVLKNCTFNGDTPNDEYSPQYDWLAYDENGVTKCHFSAIYVPTNAVNNYKSNVYVTGGIPGNTGWSKYASIIHDIAEYNG